LDATGSSKRNNADYIHIPGVNFTENFALVVDDVTFKIVINVIQNEDMEAYALEVETEFFKKEN
jgi:hypothetical protein